MNITPAQKLNDLFQICLIHLKFMDELLISTDNGLRDAEECKTKFVLGAIKLTEQYSKIKILTDEFFADASSRFPPDAPPNSIGSDTEKQVFTINC